MEGQKFVAGSLKMGWAFGPKYTREWTKPVPSVLTGISMTARPRAPRGAAG
ncbi:MAG: hypothetical protein M3397_06705 [Actinomycetota bacterium]|nr:hypothetical protein [Actinomycetota bacterium]